MDKAFVQTLKDRIDIVQVVGEYVHLERKGRGYWACCPFHHEKTPSFQVSQDQQFYHCFGCHKSGDVIVFVQEMEQISFMEAIEKLAKRAGLEVPKSNDNGEFEARKKKLEKIYEINKLAASFYFSNLKTDAGEPARQYILSRGFTKDTVVKFGMGYSPDFTSLVKFLESKGYSVKSMEEAGVVGVDEKKRPYDFYGKRLIIPIISKDGKVIGFSGRSLEKKPQFGKYKNTPATLAFNKSKVLFGLNMYRKYTEPGTRSIILVEGHLDLISLFQAGIYNVVASMGTALTQDQCREIKKFTDKVYVSYDGDSAGQHATLRGLDLLQEQGLDIQVVQLTDGLDPDDYVKKFGKEGYLKLVDEAIPLLQFKLNTLATEFNFERYDQRKKYLKECAKIYVDSGGAVNSVYDEQIAKNVKMSIEEVKSIINEEMAAIRAGVDSSSTIKTVNVEAKTNIKNDPRYIEDLRMVIAAIFYSKSFARVADFNYLYVYKTKYEPIYTMLYNKLKNGEKLKISYLFDCYNVEEEGNKEFIDKIVNSFMLKGLSKEMSEDDKEVSYYAAVKSLKEHLKRELTDAVGQKIQECANEEERQDIYKLYEDFTRIIDENDKNGIKLIIEKLGQYLELFRKEQ